MAILTAAVVVRHYSALVRPLVGVSLVQRCTLYRNATHIANRRYRTKAGKNTGRIESALVTIK